MLSSEFSSITEFFENFIGTIPPEMASLVYVFEFLFISLCVVMLFDLIRGVFRL